MTIDDLAALSRRDRIRMAVLVAVLFVAVLSVTAHFLLPGLPRHVVLASGPASGIHQRHAQRYKAILGRQGVVVEERPTAGAADNLNLLLDPKSGVDVAFMQGGVAAPAQAAGLEMLASLYYEPLWIFYRDAAN